MTTFRRAAAAAALALVLPLPLIAAAAPPAAAAATALQLPRPTGPYGVGRDQLHLLDQHRTDPWVPAAGPRQLMVSMYFPARAGSGAPAPYMTADESRMFLQYKAPGSGIPPTAMTTVSTWSKADARPVPGHYPLVLLSPGLTLPRALFSSLAEELASRGYVVALMDHTYESPGVTFPDGQTLGCVVCDVPPAGGPAAVAESRSKDASFVLDSLTSPHSLWAHARLIDRHRIGMAGHSIGGDAAAVTMATDPRVRAGANMDGTFFAPMPAGGLGGRPFLLFGAQHNQPDTTWDNAWTSLDGWKRRLTVAGADHGSFSDLPLLSAEVGRPGDPGAIDPARGLAIARTYLGDFFDLHLKGTPEPLFDGPSPAEPEVTVQLP
ncbi:alpha/beta hydrolase family protein [Kitasatospora purpeofusca]|uniref:alpha/beta hydrolase family protein n=1 Tax=Kitasatospora purpeofusca TaxID=67352 RepID=UPI0036EEEEA6